MEAGEKYQGTMMKIITLNGDKDNVSQAYYTNATAGIGLPGGLV